MLIEADGARLLRNQHASEDPLWRTNKNMPKLAEAVPVESEQPKAEINHHI